MKRKLRRRRQLRLRKEQKMARKLKRIARAMFPPDEPEPEQEPEQIEMSAEEIMDRISEVEGKMSRSFLVILLVYAVLLAFMVKADYSKPLHELMSQAAVAALALLVALLPWYMERCDLRYWQSLLASVRNQPAAE